MKKKKTTKTSALPKNVSGSINISMQQCTVVTNLNLKWLSNNPYFPFDKLDGLWFVIYVKGNYHYDVKLYLCCCILCFLILPLKVTSFIIWFLKPVGEFLDCLWMGKMYPVYPQIEFWWKSQDVRWFRLPFTFSSCLFNMARKPHRCHSDLLVAHRPQVVSFLCWQAPQKHLLVKTWNTAMHFPVWARFTHNFQLLVLVWRYTVGFPAKITDKTLEHSRMMHYETMNP